MVDPRLRPPPMCCSRCRTRCRQDGSFACGCLEMWRWETQLFWVYAALLLFVVGALPIIMLIRG